jgi:hypothetical protein
MVGGLCIDCGNLTIYNETSRVCVCKDGYFGNFSDCQECHNSCVTCSATDRNSCLSCNDKRTLTDGRCVLNSNLEQNTTSVVQNSTNTNQINNSSN